MNLLAFPLLLTLAVVVTAVAAIYLIIHARTVAALFRRTGEIAPGPGPGAGSAIRGRVVAALILFNLGWIAAVLIWVLAAEKGNELVETDQGRAIAEPPR